MIPSKKSKTKTRAVARGQSTNTSAGTRAGLVSNVVLIEKKPAILRGGTSAYLTAASNPGPNHRGGALNTNSTNVKNPKKRKRGDFESFLSQSGDTNSMMMSQDTNMTGGATRSRKRIRHNDGEEP